MFTDFCMHVWAPCVCSAHRNQARVSDPLRMELQTIMAAMNVLGIDLPSAGRTSSAMNC